LLRLSVSIIIARHIDFEVVEARTSPKEEARTSEQAFGNMLVGAMKPGLGCTQVHMVGTAAASPLDML